MPTKLPLLHRRQLLGLGSLLASAAATGQGARSPASAPAAAPAGPRTLRIASVATDVEGGLLPALMASFEAETGIASRVMPGNDPFNLARAGNADLVIAHYGHRDTEAFVTEGSGQWPRPVFSNQAVLIGPASDPAGVRGLTSAVEALRRMASRRVPFIVHANMGMAYLARTLWFAAGQPPRDTWWVEDGTIRNAGALQQAAQRGGYTLWGLTPFLRTRVAASDPAVQGLEPLVTADPLLQRLMVAVPVHPARVPGVDADAARRFVAHLLSPATQARILTLPYAGTDTACWAPAGRHNASEHLPPA